MKRFLLLPQELPRSMLGTVQKQWLKDQLLAAKGNQHVHPRMDQKGAIFSYNQPQSFGLVTFDTTRDDPQVTYAVINIDGEKPHEITVKRSQLGY